MKQDIFIMSQTAEPKDNRTYFVPQTLNTTQSGIHTCGDTALLTDIYRRPCAVKSSLVPRRKVFQLISLFSNHNQAHWQKSTRTNKD